MVVRAGGSSCKVATCSRLVISRSLSTHGLVTGSKAKRNPYNACPVVCSCELMYLPRLGTGRVVST